MELIDFLTEGADDRKVFVATDDDGNEAVKYYAKPLTPKDFQWVQKRHKGFPDRDQSEAMVDLLIRKVEDKAGEKILTIENKPALMLKGNMDRVSEMFGALFGGDLSEDAEKN